MLTRRALASLLAAITLFGRSKPAPPERRRYQILPTLWWENEAGQKHIPDLSLGFDWPPPVGFVYQHYRECSLRESICELKPDGSGPQIASFNSGWSEDLALALANDGYGLKDAIAIAAVMCERCMNAAAHEYGLKWGYQRYSDQWLCANTSCEFCKDDPVARGNSWLRGYTGYGSDPTLCEKIPKS